jgi:hypothetical protein
MFQQQYTLLCPQVQPSNYMDNLRRRHDPTEGLPLNGMVAAADDDGHELSDGVYRGGLAQANGFSLCSQINGLPSQRRF